MSRPARLQTGHWGPDLAWELAATTQLPPPELCTAAMAVAIDHGHVVLARSRRGWGLLGGHIEPGETAEAAAAREAREEGGFVADSLHLFAVRKLTATQPVAHPQPGQTYPFPISYIVYYWATTTSPLQAPTGPEILERGRFALDHIPALNTPDQFVIEAGWRAYQAALQT